MIPGWGIEITSPSAAAVAIQWYLSGGIAAANCIAAYTPKGAASLAASYDNNAAPGNGLADGTYDAAPGVAPTWGAATGWTFDGIAQYLETGVTNVGSGLWSAIVQFSNAQAAGDGALFGTGHMYVNPVWFTSGVLYDNGGPGNAQAPVLNAGNLAVAGLYGYRNGAVDTAITGGAFTADAIYIGAINYGDTALWFRDGNIQALAIYDTAITAPQVAAVSAAMAAL